MKGCWQASFYPDVTTGRGFAAGSFLLPLRPDVDVGADLFGTIRSPARQRMGFSDAIISNPPAFAHIHLAEALGREYLVLRPFPTIHSYTSSEQCILTLIPPRYPVPLQMTFSLFPISLPGPNRSRV